MTSVFFLLLLTCIPTFKVPSRYIFEVIFDPHDHDQSAP